jgi:hypothetical protein
MDRIEFVGLDVSKEYLKPSRYLVASYTNEEAEQYSPHHWFFRLVGGLQLTYENLVDTESGDFFGILSDSGTWCIKWKQGSVVGAREFSDIWLLEIEEES